MGEIDDVGTGNFDWISAVYVVFLEVPKLTYDLIPFAMPKNPSKFCKGLVGPKAVTLS